MQSPRLSELPPPPPGKKGWPWTQEPRLLPDSRSWPKITVVTPSFNQGQFIEETIRSVLLQGYPDLEYVITDGGSTDDSVEIIKRYQQWLHHWVGEPDRGQSHAINKGWSYSSGPVCAWLNSDDVYLPGTLEAAASEFISQPRAELVYGDLVFVNQQSTVEGFFRAPDFSLPELVRTNFIPQPATFIRRQAIQRTGDLDESLHLCMDYDLWLRVVQQGQAVHVPKTLAAMRLHPSSKTSMQTVRMSVELAELAARFVERSDIPLEQSGREGLLARPAWVAGTMLWFSGEHEQGKYYIDLALRDFSRIDPEEAAICVANAALQSQTPNVTAQVSEFFKKFSTVNSIANLAEGWVFALKASEPGTSSQVYRDVWRGIKRARTPRLLRALGPTLLKRLTGTSALATVLQVRRRITHSPVGMSLSELS